MHMLKKTLASSLIAILCGASALSSAEVSAAPVIGWWSAKPMTYSGTWQPKTLYTVGSVVNYQDGTWIATQASKGEAPGLSGKWLTFSGAQGPQGIAGPIGPAGPMGPQGIQGATGPEGLMGPAGPAGAVGPAGPKGDAGVAGAEGPAGPAGTGRAATAWWPNCNFEPSVTVNGFETCKLLVESSGDKQILPELFGDGGNADIRFDDVLPGSYLVSLNLSGNACAMEIVSPLGIRVIELSPVGSTPFTIVVNASVTSPTRLTLSRLAGSCDRVTIGLSVLQLSGEPV